jgi:hypothetical protein
VLAGAAVVALLGACGSSGRPPAPAPTTSATTATTSTTVPGVQSNGPRTVLSPIGLNVRAQPLKSAKILGTAAEGTVLTVLSHTDGSGGWFEVRGATVTGWIDGDPTLSASGVFSMYSSAQFSALYPATWTSSASASAGVVFRDGAGPDDIVVTSAATVAKLPQGRTGYGQIASKQIVVCGVTSDLVTYQSAGPTGTTVQGTAGAVVLAYLVQVLLPLDAHHALGLSANLTDLGAPLQVFDEFLASLSFPSPQCIG